MTDEERILWAEELDTRFATLHTFVAESISKTSLELDGGYEALKTDMLGILFELNIEFDLNIRSDEFWFVEAGPREDGSIHIEVIPRVLAEARDRGEVFEIVEHEQTPTSRRYTAGLGPIVCQSDSHLQAMITLAHILESQTAMKVIRTITPTKKEFLN